MKPYCLCEPCEKEMRWGNYPYPHYIYTKLTALEAYLIRLREQGKLEFLGRGRHREAYLSPSGKTVIKFPVSYDGILANKSERNIFVGKTPTYKIEGDPGSCPAPKRKDLAGCRMIGYSVLVMTKVDISGIDDDFVENHAPLWAMGIDCYQVGWHPKTKKLVAFDYSAS